MPNPTVPTVQGDEELREIADAVFVVTTHHSQVPDYIFKKLCEIRDRTQEAIYTKAARFLRNRFVAVAQVKPEVRRVLDEFAAIFEADAKESHAKR